MHLKRHTLTSNHPLPSRVDNLFAHANPRCVRYYCCYVLGGIHEPPEMIRHFSRISIIVLHVMATCPSGPRVLLCTAASVCALAKHHVALDCLMRPGGGIRCAMSALEMMQSTRVIRTNVAAWGSVPPRSVTPSITKLSFTGRGVASILKCTPHSLSRRMFLVYPQFTRDWIIRQSSSAIRTDDRSGVIFVMVRAFDGVLPCQRCNAVRKLNH